MEWLLSVLPCADDLAPLIGVGTLAVLYLAWAVILDPAEPAGCTSGDSPS